MTKLTDKQSNSEVINSSFSLSINAQKYMKEALKKVEKEIDKIEQDVENLEDNN